MSIRRFLSAAALAAQLAGCTQSDVGRGAVEPRPDPILQPQPQPGPDRPALPGDALALARAQNELGLDLFQQIRGSQRGNFAFSPTSLHVALGMTAQGARGRTLDEMRHVLHLDALGERAAGAYGALVRDWNDEASRAYELRVANRLFGAHDIRFQSDFAAVTRDQFGAEAESMDFSGQNEPSRRRINDWIAAQTRDRIRDLIPAGALPRETRLVLTNAVYFKGRWATQFVTSQTRDRAFQLDGQRTVNVPMMHQHERHRYVAQDGMRAVEMAYEGGDMAMMVIVPDDPQGLDALESRLDGATMQRWIEAMHETRVEVALPRFEIDPPESIGMNGPLAALGMQTVFTDAADLSGIAGEGLKIDSIFHKAFVEVNEEGTEAAAGTGIIAGPTSVQLDPPAVTADRPFLFAIRDLRTGAILFLGRVADPR